MNVKTGLKMLVGAGVFAGLIGLVFAGSGNWGAMLGALVVGLGFVGLAWAGKKMFFPEPGKGPLNGISLVIKVIFGGAGLAMMIGGVFLFVDGDFAAAIGMLIFGGIFCAVAYFGSRSFAEPKGVKAVMVSRHTKSIESVLGKTGSLTQSAYMNVDEKMDDAEIEQMKKIWAEKPWTMRPDWASGEMLQEGTRDIRLLVVFTLLWNIIGWGIAAFGIASEWDSGDVPWFLLVFPAFGIVLMVVALCTWIRKRKFGFSTLRFRTLPAYLGERLQATVQTGVSVLNDPAKEFVVRLICARRTTVLNAGSDERVTEKKLWSDEQKVFGEVSSIRPVFQVLVDFHIPDDLSPTELFPEDDRTLWRLEVAAKLKGVDYAAQFEVPVYRRPAGA